MNRYRFVVVNDRGVHLGSYSTREEARAQKDRHNAIAKKQKDRGDIVSLRYAVGIVKIDQQAELDAARARLAARKPRKRRAAA